MQYGCLKWSGFLFLSLLFIHSFREFKYDAFKRPTQRRSQSWLNNKDKQLMKHGRITLSKRSSSGVHSKWRGSYNRKGPILPDRRACPGLRAHLWPRSYLLFEYWRKCLDHAFDCFFNDFGCTNCGSVCE